MVKEREIVPKWNVEIHGNKVVFELRKEFDAYLIPFEGKQMHLILKKRHKSRSRAEEKYFHAVVCHMIGEAMSISADEAKEFLRGLFLEIEEKSPAGYRYTRLLSTTELSDKAYHKFIFDEVLPWAALPTGEDGLSRDSGLQLRLPLPNEVSYDDY